MLSAPLRPGDLKDLRFADLLHLETLQLNVFDPKVKGKNRIPCGQEAIAIFSEARGLTTSVYVFPRCIRNTWIAPSGSQKSCSSGLSGWYFLLTVCAIRTWPANVPRFKMLLQRS